MQKYLQALKSTFIARLEVLLKPVKMATRSTTKNISIRKNRDYSKDFEWTADLKQDVYNCYLEAKRDPSKGYTKRLKALWDEKHPSYAHLNEKTLRQRATFVEAKLRQGQPIDQEPHQQTDQVEHRGEENHEPTEEPEETGVLDEQPRVPEVNMETSDDNDVNKTMYSHATSN